MWGDLHCVESYLHAASREVHQLLVQLHFTALVLVDILCGVRREGREKERVREHAKYLCVYCTHLVEDDVEDVEPRNPQGRGQDPQPEFTPLALLAPTLLETLQELLLTCHGGWVRLNIPQGGSKILSPPPNYTLPLPSHLSVQCSRPDG